MEWECLVRATHDAYEVCFEDLNQFLCNILPLVMWGYMLVLHVVEFDSFLEIGRTLIV